MKTTALSLFATILGACSTQPRALVEVAPVDIAPVDIAAGDDLDTASPPLEVDASNCPEFPLADTFVAQDAFFPTAERAGELVELYRHEGEAISGGSLSAYLCDGSDRALPFKYVAGPDPVGFEQSYLLLESDVEEPVEALLVHHDYWDGDRAVSLEPFTVLPAEPPPPCAHTPSLWNSSAHDPFVPSATSADGSGVIVFGAHFDASTVVTLLDYPSREPIGTATTTVFQGAVIVLPSSEVAGHYVEVQVTTDCGTVISEGQWLYVH